MQKSEPLAPLKTSKITQHPKPCFCEAATTVTETNYGPRQKNEDSIFDFFRVSLTPFIKKTASFFADNYLNDKKSGLFGIFDGHGGSDVSEYSAKYFKDVIHGKKF
jgi:serine/threonine protein phosphatase PrpC